MRPRITFIDARITYSGGKHRKRRMEDRSRSNMWAVLDISCRTPSANEVAGKSVSPSAAIAPLMPTINAAGSNPASTGLVRLATPAARRAYPR